MNSSMWIATIALGLACAGSCSKKTGDASGGNASSATPAAPAATKADADAINALVPAELKDKIAFEVGTIDDGMGRHQTTYALVVPKGWKRGFMPGSLEPADADSFGSKTLGKTTLKVGSNCDGSCTAKDWAAVVDKVYYKQFTSGEVTGKVIKDDKQKNRRTLVFQQEPTVQENAGTMTTTVNGKTATTSVTATSGSKGIRVIETWWTDGDSKHYVCEAELGEPAMALAAAFEKACDKVSEQ